MRRGAALAGGWPGNSIPPPSAPVVQRAECLRQATTRLRSFHPVWHFNARFIASLRVGRAHSRGLQRPRWSSCRSSGLCRSVYSRLPFFSFRESIQEAQAGSRRESLTRPGRRPIESQRKQPLHHRWSIVSNVLSSQQAPPGGSIHDRLARRTSIGVKCPRCLDLSLI